MKRKPALRFQIESWAKRQNDKPSRSEAIRRLLEFALKARAKRQNAADK
jgi:metal-responsive CopG/Arc/MetJ family transcriptional regulator